MYETKKGLKNQLMKAKIKGYWIWQNKKQNNATNIKWSANFNLDYLEKYLHP